MKLKKKALLRLKKLKKKIKKNPKIKALLVTTSENLNYLTKSRLFSRDGEKGISLITPSQSFLFVSPLIYKQLVNFITTNHSSGNALTLIPLKSKKTFYSQLKRTITDTRLPPGKAGPHLNYSKFKLGFEENSLKWKEYQNLKTKLTKIKAGVNVDLIPTKNIIENLRIIKEIEEIRNIEKAVNLTKKAFLFINNQLKPGNTEKQIAWKMEKFLRENGADNLAFPIIIASGNNSSIPHHQTGNRRLKKNDIVLIDAGCKINGYCSDMTRTFFIGKPKPEWEKIYRIVKTAQEKVLKTVNNKQSPISNSLKSYQLDAIARNYIKKKGLGKKFIHSLGHGIGLDIHERPYISPKSKQTLKSDMVFTVEPGIYIQGKFGVRIEDICILPTS